MNERFSELAKLAGGLLGRWAYAKTTGRSWDLDAGYVNTVVNDPRILALDIGNSTWNAASGRNLYADIETVTSKIEFAKGVLQDPNEAIYNIAKQKLTGKLPEDTLMRLVKYVLSDESEREFTVTDQETLHRISKDTLKGKYIDALYDPSTGKKYLDKEIASDRGKKYVAKLHEKLEEKQGRPDNSNDEEEHVKIHLNVLEALRAGYKNLEGDLKQRAKEGIEAYYRMLDEASPEDDLFSKVRQRVPRKEVLSALDKIEL